MFKVELFRTVVLAMLLTGLSVQTAQAAEPDWSPIVIPRGEYRAEVKSLPIEQRPYRPLHFYGNTVRRNHYRGNPVAMPRDIRNTAGELVRR